MIIIDKTIVQATSVKAQQTNRLRANYNIHQEFSDPINRFLNAIEPGSYVQPHKHEDPDKREMFILLSGSLLVVEFNDYGEPLQHTILSIKTGNLCVEIPPKAWHTILALESGSVVLEIKDGPYAPIDDKNFAKWAPTENQQKENQEYMELLKKRLIS